MKKIDQQFGKPEIAIRLTTTQINALTGLVGGEHVHDTVTGHDGYYDEVQAAWVLTDTWVKKTGDTMTGGLGINGVPTYSLDVYDGNVALVIGADETLLTRTNSTTKSGRLGIPHYTNTEEPVAMFLAQSTSTENSFNLGGGSALLNAATSLAFYTATNNTTTIGTERMRITNAGSIGIGTSTPVSLLHLNNSTDGNKLLLQTADSTVGKYTGLLFKISTNIENFFQKAGVLFERTGGNGVGKLHLVNNGTADNSNATLTNAILTITSAGNTGIGITAPTAKFHVVGNSDIIQTIIKAHSTQTANLVEHQDSSAGIHNRFNIPGSASALENVFNETGNQYLDFRVETDNYNAIFIDASNESIVLMSNAAGKVGFFGATAIVRPTTAIAAATFVANTSGITNDTATFDGYTIGQVVKALRNIGILA